MTDFDISITYGPEAGDCTRQYYITLKRKDITVDEFIKWVLKQTREWGYISIGGKNPFKSDYSLEYKYGVAKSYGVIPKNILKSVIFKASGSGGWTRSDYHLTIKKKVKGMSVFDWFKGYDNGYKDGYKDGLEEKNKQSYNPCNNCQEFDCYGCTFKKEGE